MSDSPDIESTTIGEYSIRVERYDDFMTCTVWGPHTIEDVIAVGNTLFNPWTLLGRTPPYHRSLPSVWGLSRNRISEDVSFQRFDSRAGPSLTYGFNEGSAEIGILSNATDPIRVALGKLIGEKTASPTQLDTLV